MTELFVTSAPPRTYASSMTYGTPVPEVLRAYANLSGVGDDELGGFWDIVKKVAGYVAEPIVAPTRFAVNTGSNIAHGVRIDKAFSRAGEIELRKMGEEFAFIKNIAPYIQMGISFIPGIGTGVSAAIGAGLALAEGKPISEAILAGVKGALPGGPLAAAAFDAAVAAAQAIAQGKKLDEIGMAALRTTIPGGAAGKAAFDVATALMQGKKLQEAGLSAAEHLLPDNELAHAAFDVTKAALKGKGPAALKPGTRPVANPPLPRSMNVGAPEPMHRAARPVAAPPKKIHHGQAPGGVRQRVKTRVAPPVATKLVGRAVTQQAVLYAAGLGRQ